MSQHYTYETDADGIVTITLDMVGKPVNTMNKEFDIIIEELATRLENDDKMVGAVLTSAKKTFFAGGDLNWLKTVEPSDAEAFFNRVELLKSHMRRIELLGKPVVAAINGAALGGGLEICLMCHARVALSNPKTELGFPEVTLGLLPGGGGVTRLVRMMGLARALSYLTEGTRIKVGKSLEEGWVDAVVDTPEEMIAWAKTWIKDNPNPVKPWDEKGFKIPGGGPGSPALAQLLTFTPAMIRKKTRGLMPAPEVIFAAATEGAAVDFETASRIEARAFTKLATGPVAKNLISTFFFGMNAVNGGAGRPDGFEKTSFKKIGVLGAGMMGAGIAFVTAKAGMDVVLKDITQESADKGKAYSEKLLDKAITKGRSTEEKKAAILSKIHATADVNDLADCDLIIEAVFEDETLKDKVIKETEAVLREGVVFASNTSTMPIGMLAGSARDASKFIGLHFFSPVDRMALVEIITGKDTSDETLAVAFDFVQAIRKTPISVNDSLGFFTSRVFATFVDEGSILLKEGVSPVLIDNLARLAGMPVGPITVTDEVSQQLIHNVDESNIRLIERFDINPDVAKRYGSPETCKTLVEAGRKGRAHGGGFYSYEGGEKTVWDGLEALFPANPDHGISHDDIKDRIIFRQVVESLKCLEENVLKTVLDGNIGSIFGIGFPQYTGGVFQHINTYGVDKFIARLNELEQQYGERFKVPAILATKAASGETFE